jgi:hypothetical protein
VAAKSLKLPRADTCVIGAASLPAGTCAWWDQTARTVTCATCHASVAVPARPSEGATEPELDRGQPGGSLAREYERRRRRREESTRAAHPHLGGLLLALREPPQYETAFRRGEQGRGQWRITRGSDRREPHDPPLQPSDAATSTSSRSHPPPCTSSTPKTSAVKSASSNHGSANRSCSSTAATAGERSGDQTQPHGGRFTLLVCRARVRTVLPELCVAAPHTWCVRGGGAIEGIAALRERPFRLLFTATLITSLWCWRAPLQGAAQGGLAVAVLGGSATVPLFAVLSLLYRIRDGLVVPAQVGLVPQTVRAKVAALVGSRSVRML